jgi:hypothetical protein
LESNNKWISVSIRAKSLIEFNNSGSISVNRSISRSSDSEVVSISCIWDLSSNFSCFYSVIILFVIKILETDLDFWTISLWCESTFKVNVFVSTIVLRCNLDICTVSVVFESIIQIDFLLLSWYNCDWMYIDWCGHHFLEVNIILN